MSYPTTLNTNEIKDSAGVEQEFGRIGSSDRQLTFALLTEVPSRPHRISIKHVETGSGLTLRRRSLVRVDKTILGQVDTTKTVTISAYAVVDAPIGQMTAVAEIANTVANLVSNLASRGATTTILYDGTGYGAEALIYGSL
jgi:hypothetical protein